MILQVTVRITLAKSECYFDCYKCSYFCELSINHLVTILHALKCSSTSNYLWCVLCLVIESFLSTWKVFIDDFLYQIVIMLLLKYFKIDKILLSLFFIGC